MSITIIEQKQYDQKSFKFYNRKSMYRRFLERREPKLSGEAENALRIYEEIAQKANINPDVPFDEARGLLAAFLKLNKLPSSDKAPQSCRRFSELYDIKELPPDFRNAIDIAGIQNRIREHLKKPLKAIDLRVDDPEYLQTIAWELFDYHHDLIEQEKEDQKIRTLCLEVAKIADFSLEGATNYFGRHYGSVLTFIQTILSLYFPSEFTTPQSVPLTIKSLFRAFLQCTDQEMLYASRNERPQLQGIGPAIWKKIRRIFEEPSAKTIAGFFGITYSNN